MDQSRDYAVVVEPAEIAPDVPADEGSPGDLADVQITRIGMHDVCLTTSQAGQ